MPQQNDENFIASLERRLNVKLPRSYESFLKNERSPYIINGLPILGLPTDLDSTSSALGATEFLRSFRDEQSLIAIRLLDVRALCLDLENGSEKDAPLVEVNLKNKDIKPIRVHDSFGAYIEEGEKTKQHIREAYDRIREFHNSESSSAAKWRRYDHKYGKSFPRADEWKVIRSCVHDEVVGISSFKYSVNLNGILIDIFLVTDHPNYEEGHGARSLTLLLFSEAYRSGNSMQVHFTRNVNNGRLPVEIIKLAEENGIHLEEQHQGTISHDEAVGLFSKLTGIPPEAKGILERKGNGLTVQAVSFVISSGIWTFEEAMWLLLNHPRPEGILLGKDLPEDRLFFLESLQYGRDVLAASKLRQAILNQLEGKEGSYCLLHPKDDFFILESSHSFFLPWLIEERERVMEAQQSLKMFPCIRRAILEFPIEIAHLQSFIKNSKDAGIVLAQDLQNEAKVSHFLKKAREIGLHVLSLPFTIQQMDEEVEKRMAQARVIRK